MNSEKNVKFYMKNVVEKFGNELKKYEPDFDLPCILFGSFALFVSGLINKKEKSNQNKLIESIQLIEDMALSEDEDVQDLLMVGFLEVFADENTSVKYVKENLSQNINNKLKIILNYWGRNLK